MKESQRERLLFEVVEFLISGEMRVAQAGTLGFYFDRVFARGGGIAGDPGWGVMYIPDHDGLGTFLLESDPEYSSSEIGEAVFGADEVFHVVECQLAAYSECYPESTEIVKAELARLPAYREGLHA